MAPRDSYPTPHEPQDGSLILSEPRFPALEEDEVFQPHRAVVRLTCPHG